MGKKNKKRKQTVDADKANEPTHVAPASAVSKPHKRNPNPLQSAQQTFFKSLPSEAKLHFFSPTHITPEQRAEIWENQADLGENLINKYAWATPDSRLLKVFQHFGPIVEVGCGSNAYWAKWMHAEGGVDVIAFDESLDSGGKINVDNWSKIKKKKKNDVHKDEGTKEGRLVIRCGGPSILSTDSDVRDSGRTLFLCYPDEEEYQGDDSEDESDDDQEHQSKPKSMAAACLEHFTGSTIIHVGELYGDTLCMDQSPWGRSSSNEFQERLAAKYHCILKMKLQNNWLHVRDSLSVWKRTETCCMVYENDDGEEGSAEEDEYKYIPPEEELLMDLAAPCVAHLLQSNELDTKKLDPSHSKDLSSEKNQPKKVATSDKGFTKKKTKKQKSAVVAGEAW